MGRCQGSGGWGGILTEFPILSLTGGSTESGGVLGVVEV